MCYENVISAFGPRQPNSGRLVVISVKRIVTLVVCGGLAVVLAGCGGSGGGSKNAGNSGSNADGDITIGYAGDFSGDFAEFDGAERDGAKFAVDQINANGGVNGHKIKFLTKDTDGKQAQAVKDTQELIDDGATFLFGTPSAPYDAEAAVACKAKVPITTGDLTPPTAVKKAGPCAYQLVFQDNQQAAVVAQEALELGDKTAYILTSPDHPYTAQLPVYFAKAFKHGGGKIVGHDKFKLGGGDFTVQASKIAQLNPPPDVVFTGMFGQDLPTFVKELRQAGVKSTYMTGEVLTDPSVLKIGSPINGSVGTTHAWPHDHNAMAKFYKAYKKANGKKPDSPVVALGYNAIMVVKHIVEKNGGHSSAAAITKGLNNLDYHGITGHMTMNPKTHKVTVDITLMKIKNDRFQWLGIKRPKFTPKPVKQ
jgi:branched-chain amino acid transport system substrate-binding protein